jgi:hypothetical protein
MSFVFAKLEDVIVWLPMSFYFLSVRRLATNDSFAERLLFSLLFLSFSISYGRLKGKKSKTKLKGHKM